MATDLRLTRDGSALAQIWVAAWPWLVLGLGIAAVVVGGIFFSPS